MRAAEAQASSEVLSFCRTCWKEGYKEAKRGFRAFAFLFLQLSTKWALTRARCTLLAARMCQRLEWMILAATGR